jgi:hypothetical protein
MPIDGIKGLTIKDVVRLYGVPAAARFGRVLGKSWTEIGSVLGREALIAQAGSLNGVHAAESAAPPLDVVFATFQGMNHHVVSVDVVLARALRARGHRIRFVLCDQVLPLCQTKHAGWEHKWDRFCGQCYGFARRYIEAAGFEVLTFSELMEVDPPTDERWASYVESALLKHYRVGTLPDTPEVAERRDLFRQTAAISASVGRRLVSMRPDRVIMSHGLYCTWGPARETLLEAEIPVVTSGPGKKKDTITLNWSVSSDNWDVSREWERVRDRPLTPEQNATLDAYLHSRRLHTEDARVYNFGAEESVEDTKARLQLDSEKPTFTLFTNVLWDAASAQREIAFSNPIEWVMETIKWFGSHPELQLVIKIHPSEIVIGTKQPFAQEIARHVPSVPPNVRIIEPQEEVNSWSIAKVTDLGIVHTSTVGMELPLEGVPCMVVSKTHYRGKGFTEDVASREEYFEVLENWNGSRIDEETMRTLARRYAYVLFERYQLPFPFTFEVGLYDVRALTNIAPEELNAHPTIRMVAEAIETRTDILLPA